MPILLWLKREIVTRNFKDFESLLLQSQLANWIDEKFSQSSRVNTIKLRILPFEKGGLGALPLS